MVERITMKVVIFVATVAGAAGWERATKCIPTSEQPTDTLVLQHKDIPGLR